ncbi:RHS repeat-associated core domain-containing protein [Halomonas denitrificans]|nr:hypothetical protein [Halomonas denitrificans]
MTESRTRVAAMALLIVLTTALTTALTTVATLAEAGAVRGDPSDLLFTDSFESPISDMRLAKSASVDEIEVEQAFQYVLSVDNLGPDDATDLDLADTLPAGVDVTALAADAPLLCSSGPGTVTCTADVLPLGSYTVTIDVVAPDTAGAIVNSATLSVSSADPSPVGTVSDGGVQVLSPPPPGEGPQVLPPPVHPGQISPVRDTAASWTTGSNPPQTGVTPGALDERRASLRTGRVVDRAGAPIEGVVVRALNAPDLGQTQTDANGYYTFAFNAGGATVLDFQSPDRLPVQRRFTSAWNEWGRLEDIVMTGIDVASQTTSPVPGAGHWHDASTETDSDGSRTGRLYLRPGTELAARLPDDSLVPLGGTLNLSVTEYTVGPSGPAAMPGLLPDSSGYTYAAEVRVAEAEALGAARVELSVPAVLYLDDFIGFGPGAPVPVGVYDRQIGAWRASENGFVLTVLGINGGEAEIDLTGDGLPASPAELDAVGIDAGERTQLADLVVADYAGGPVDLWRAELPHFSPWDLNWPLGPPDDAVPPPSLSPDRPADNTTPDPDPPTDPGFGRIVIETRALIEQVPIAGTPFQLVHSSRRQPGRVAVVDVPVIGEGVPAGLLSARVELNVAGRRLVAEFDGADLTAGLRAELVWDGKDVFGRSLNGAQPATVSVTYRYPGRFGFGPAGRSFGLPAVEEPPFFVSARRPAELTTDTRLTVDAGGVDAAGVGLGGWVLDAHHAYDPVAGVLERGDGQVRRVPPSGRTVSFVAGCDPAIGPCEQDTSAAQALFSDARLFAVGPDGAIYVADSGGTIGARRVRRIDPLTGTVETVAGRLDGPGGGVPGCTGPTDPCGDGGAATDAWMELTALVIAPDGALLLGDAGVTNRIRRVDPATGVIESIVGNGQVCPQDQPCGDGGPATQAALGGELVKGELFSAIRFGVAADGTLFLEHGFGNRIRRVGPDGTIHTVLGVQAPGWTNDCSVVIIPSAPGGRTIDLEAVRECPGIFESSNDLVVTPEGAVIWTTENANVEYGVVRLSPLGELTIVAGFGSGYIGAPGAGLGDGGIAVSAPMNFGGPVLAPDGSILVGAVPNWQGAGRVRRITPDGLIGSVIGYGGNGPAGIELGGVALIQPLVDGFALPAVAPDGTVHLLVKLPGGTDSYRVVRLDPPLPGLGLGQGELAVADPTGRLLDVFDQRGRHLRVVSALTGETLRSFVHNAEGRLDSVVDHTSAGTTLVTRVERDAGGAPSAIVGPYGHRTELAVDGNGHLSAITDPDGATTTVVARADGLLQSITGPRTGVDPAVDTTYSFAWTATGELASATDPIGGVTSLTRTVDNGVTRTTRTGPDGLSTEIARQGLFGGAVRRTALDAMGNTTVVEELADGRQRRIDADGTITTWRLAPDPRFGMSAPVVERVETDTPDPGRDPLIATSTREVALDAGGDLQSQTETVTVGEGPAARTTVSTFDAALRTWTVSTPTGRTSSRTLDAWAREIAVERRSDAPVTWIRDGEGRITAQTRGAGPNARTTTFTYDGPYAVAWTDAVGRTTTVTRDAHGRVLSITRPDGEIEVTDRDAHGNLVTVVAPDAVVDKTHLQDFDPRDELVAYGDPDGGTTVFSRSPRGHVDGVDRPDGTLLDFLLTAGRLDARQQPGLGAVSWSYTGSRLSGGTADAISALAWDGRLLVSEAWTDLFAAGDGQATVTREYDETFRPIGETIDGVTVAFAYDGDDLLVQAGAQSIVRDPQTGLALSRTVDDVTVSHDYDDFGALVGVTATHDTLGILYDLVVARDDVGRVIQRIETIDGQTTTWDYAYDAIGRLAEVVETPSGQAARLRTYQYDENGNLVVGPAGIATSTAGDRLLGYGGRVFHHDAAGDLESIDAGGAVTLFDYDAAGRLLGVDLPDGTDIDYRHDAADRRVARIVDGVAEAGWIYGPGPSPVARLDPADDSVVTRFVYGEKAATPDYLVHQGVRHIVVWDERGTPRLVVDSLTGTIVERLDTDELGAAVGTSPWTLVPLGYRGGLLEPATGLVRFGARDYDPSLGRFTTRDPILFRGGQTNLYLFAAGDPVNLADPTGFGPASGGGGGEPPACSGDGPSTEGRGLAASGALGPVGVGASAGIAGDGTRPALQINFSAGVGPSSVGQVFAGTYYSETQGELSSGLGFSDSIGATGAYFVGGGLERTVDTAGNTGTVSYSGVGMGAEAHLNVNATITVTGPEYDPQPGLQSDIAAGGFHVPGGCKL